MGIPDRSKDTFGQTATMSSLKVNEAERQEQSLFKAPFMFDLEDEFHVEDSDKNSPFIDTASQRNHIKNSLLNMMDDEPVDSTEYAYKNTKTECQPQQEVRDAT